MNKWKDTARIKEEITKKFAYGEKVVIPKNALVIIEKELPDGSFKVWDTNPNPAERRHYKVKSTDIIMEDYSDTRDINMQMLLADGWDAQDLLRRR